MDIGQLIAVLIGLVAGSVLQTVTGLFTDARADRRTHKVWLRERRWEAACRLLDGIAGVVGHVFNKTDKAMGNFLDEMTTINTAHSQLEALLSLEDAKALDGHVAAMRDGLIAIRDSENEAAETLARLNFKTVDAQYSEFMRRLFKTRYSN